MPRTTHLTGAAPGHPRNWIRYFKLDRTGPRTVRLRFMPYRQVAENHYWGVYCNGALRTVVASSAFNITEVSITNDIGDASAYVYLEDFGQWPVDPHTVIDPGVWAKSEEANYATRLSFGWTSPTVFSQANGGVSVVLQDSQIANISITGMQRKLNVEDVPDMPTRGQLSYAIYNNAGTYTVRWFKSGLVVAEGTRTGDGALTCSAINDSGLSIDCTITFSAVVMTGVAFVQLIWPEYYQVHYSTSALSFPRTPEMIAYDIGGDTFAARSTVLAANTWYAALVPVRDGVEQSSGITTYTKTVNGNPLPVTLGTPTGNAAATVINWTVGESGCTFKVYSGKIGEAINFGDKTNPAVIGPTAADATSATIPAVASYPGVVQVVVRATKSGQQEAKDQILYIEYDGSGNILAARPNRASIYKISTSGLTVNVDGIVLCAESDIQATELDLFVVEVGDTFDFTSPQATVALSAPINGVQRASLSKNMSPTSGWVKIALRAKAGSSLSYAYSQYEVSLQTTAPGSPGNVTVDVMRGWKGQD